MSIILNAADAMNNVSIIPQLFNLLLVIHIIFGFTAFVAAPVAMLVKKGSTKHRLFGKIFFWCMTGIVLSAFAMSVIHSNPFLFMVSGFSYYAVASGYRWIYNKKVKSIRDIAAIDWILIACAAVFNLSLFAFGCYLINTEPDNSFSYISTVFGALGLLLVWKNFRQYVKPSQKKYAWVLNHMGGMVGGYVATVTAFSAVNFNFLPTIIQWLWPSIIGVPLIFIWINFYKRNFRNGKQVNEMVEVRESN